MSYAKPLVVNQGLQLGFTPESADVDNDVFISLGTDGTITKMSSIPGGRISGGDLTESTSSVLTITGGDGALLSGVSVQVKQASGSQSGYLSSSDWTSFNSKMSSSLTSGYLWVGDGSNVAAAVQMTGDVTINSSGVAAIGTGVIVNADINNSAAIALTKLATTTVSRAIVSDGSGYLTVSATTAAQIGYLSNITGDVQASLTALSVQIAGQATNAIVQSPTSAQNGYAIVWDNGAGEYTLAASGSGGSITGPGSSVDNALVTWDGTTGTVVQSNAYNVTLDDLGNLATLLSVKSKALWLLDSDDSNVLILSAASNLSADRTLSLVTGDSNRTITLSGNPTLADWFDQSVKTTADAVFISATVSNTGGLRIVDTDASNNLIITTSSNLSADRTLTFVPGDSNRTLTINASGTIYVTGGTDVTLADGGTGASLSDPNYDAVFVWDNTTNQTRLASLSGLSYNSGTNTLTASGGGGSSPFSDAGPLVYQDADNTATITFSAANISTGTNRTFTLPDADGNIIVDSGTYSDPSWITSLDWSKITSTPTTYSGYGLTAPLIFDGASNMMTNNTSLGGAFAFSFSSIASLSGTTTGAISFTGGTTAAMVASSGSLTLGASNVINLINGTNVWAYTIGNDATFGPISTGATDGSIYLQSKGAGFVGIKSGSATGEVRLYQSTNYVGFKSGTLSGSVVWTLPTADGSSGQVLSTNGSGVLSWASASSPSIASLSEMLAGTDNTKMVTPLRSRSVTQRVYNVEAYGAVHDVQRVYDGSISASSTTLTSTTGGFAASDVGKNITISGAGVSGAELTTTIAAYTSSTQVTVTASASTTVSGTATVDWGTDDAAAIQAASDAACAAFGGIVYFPKGIYGLWGALQTSVDGVNPNSQIAVRAVTSSNYNNVYSIVFRGEAGYPISFYDNTFAKGTILRSFIRGSGTRPAVIGGRGISTAFNYTYLSIENMVIQVFTNGDTRPVELWGVNGENISGMSLSNSLAIADGSISAAALDPTANEVGGFFVSRSGNGGMNTITNCSSSGFKYGWVIGEHTYGVNVFANGNIYGFTFPSANQEIKINGGAFCNKYNIFFPNATTLGIAAGDAHVNLTLGLENTVACSGKWYSVTQDILDSGSYGHGVLRWNKPGSTNQYNISYTTTESLNLQKVWFHQLIPGQYNMAGDKIVEFSGTVAGASTNPVFMVGNNISTSANNNYGQLWVYANQTGTATKLIGHIGAFNSAISGTSTTERRMLLIETLTNGAVNTSQVNTYLLNAGTLTQILNYTPTSIRNAVAAYFGGVGTSPTARIHIAAESTTASTEPIRFTTPASLTTSAVAGSFGVTTTGNQLYFTNASATRTFITAQAAASLTSGRAPTINASGLVVDSGMSLSTAGAVSIPTTDYSTGVYYRIVDSSVSSRRFDRQFGSGNVSTTGDGASSNGAYDTSTLPNNTVIWLKIITVIVKSDGSEAGSIEGSATWRKDNSGVLTKVGDNTALTTEDIAGTVTFATTNSGAVIQATITRSSTSGNFRHATYLDAITHSY